MLEIFVTVVSGQVFWICTGRNKTLPPSTNLPVIGYIAGVNMASLSKCPHSQFEDWGQMGGRVPQ